MAPQDILEMTAKFLDKERDDIMAHRIDNTEQLVVVVVAPAGQKFTVTFSDMGYFGGAFKRSQTTIPAPSEPVAPAAGPHLFSFFEDHLTKAAINALESAGLLDVEKLREVDDSELLKIPGIGGRTVEIIRTMLAEEEMLL